MRGKPELIKLRTKSGKLKSPYWYIQYFEDGRGKRRSTGYRIGTQDHEANLALASFTLERNRPTQRPPEDMLIVHALQDYFHEHAQFLATADNAKRHQKRFEAFFGTRTIAHITKGTIDGYIREARSANRSDGTTRRELAYLIAALNHAHAEGRLTHVPKVKLPPTPQPRDRVLSAEEIERLLDACVTPHVHAFIILALNTGQRPGAIETLRWDQVDFEERILHFERTGKRQTNKRANPVPMNDQVYALLIELNGQADSEYVLEYGGQSAGCTKKAFERTCKRAGLQGVSRYTLRHTFGTHLYKQGVHEKTIADLMGHTSAQTTMKHYLKTDAAQLRQTVDTMGLTTQKLRKTYWRGGSTTAQRGGKAGAAEKNRTSDPVITNDVLYH